MSNVKIVMFFLSTYPCIRPRGVIGYPHVSATEVELKDEIAKLVGGEDGSGYVLLVTRGDVSRTSHSECLHTQCIRGVG